MRFKMDEEMAEKIKRIKLLVSDVDGVLTDGRIIYDSEGGESRFFDAQDGLGIRLLKAAGIKTIFVTAKPSKAVERRATDLLVEKVYQGIKPKTKVLEKILSNVDISKEEICYVGDDLVDLSVMKAVGFPVAVANACWEIKESANYITRKSGGRGAVREVVELILMTQGKWNEAIDLEIGS